MSTQSLSNELRNKLLEEIKKDPARVAEELAKDPALMELLLRNDQELQQTKNELNAERTERVKYINMNAQTQWELQQKADELKTTQGLLIGAAVVTFLALLSKKK